MTNSTNTYTHTINKVHTPLRHTSLNIHSSSELIKSLKEDTIS